MKLLLAVSLAIIAWAGKPGEDPFGVQETTQQTQQLTRQLQTTTNPQQQNQIREQIDQNLNSLDRTADQNNTNPQALDAVGSAFVTLEEGNRARRIGEEYVKLDPKSDKAYLLRGHAKYLQQDYQGALHDAAMAYRLNPGNRGAAGLIMLAKGRAGEFKAPPKNAGLNLGGQQPEVEKIPKQPSMAPKVDVGLADAEKALGNDPQLALKLAGDAIMANPSNGGAHLVAAEARLKLGDNKGALLEAEQAQNLGADKAKALSVAAKAYLGAGNSAAALREAEKALAANPRDKRAQAARLMAKLGLGEPAEALLAELKTLYAGGDVETADYEFLMARLEVGKSAPDMVTATPVQAPPLKKPWMLLAAVGAGALLIGAGLYSRRQS